MRRAYIALFLALLPCVVTRLHHPIPHMQLSDFQVYYTGALLVHAGDGPRLYAGADTGSDPQKQSAPSTSPMAVTGRSLGLPDIQLYLYPPVLADLLLPLTHIGLLPATRLWVAANVLLIVLTTISLAIALGLPLLSRSTALILLALLCFTPVISSFSWGQITILLLCLWSLGVAAYARGLPAWSGAAFALATAIKLTPILILVPFLIWREWRWLRGFAAALLATVLATAYLNTPAALQVYFRKVVPAMAGALPDVSNLSIVAGVELLSAALHGHAIFPPPTPVPHLAMLTGKLVSALLLGVILALLLRFGRRLRFADRVLTVALLSLVAPIISPVSWLHAYALAFVALTFLWADALRSEPTTPYLVSLTLVSVLVGSYFPSVILTYLVRQTHHTVLTSILLIGELLLWFAVVCYRLNQMRAEPLSSATIARA